jgi:pimeloyl-ACP methyl ester carboxylesterase
VSKHEFTFPTEYHEFHKDQLFNFQLNRWYSLGYTRFEEMNEVGRRVKTLADWKAQMLRLAEKAVSEERPMNAAFYYRAAEFYTTTEDPDKEYLYDRFIELFNRAFEGDGIERFNIPYEGTFLPAIRVPAVSGTARGTILMHGGFDSFIEEFYSMMSHFSDDGYEVIGFEGPGQGAALKKYGLALDYEWEKPTAAVLDHCALDDVTILGLSMGGYFSLRAAAFEPRVKRVIASGHAIDYTKMPPLLAQWLLKVFVHFEGLVNSASRSKMRKDPFHRWQISQAMYITKAATPAAAMRTLLQLNEKNLHCELIGQDVLILTGREDHFIPFKMHDMQVRALTNARSVRARVFTKEEQAHNHCQIGNIGLALDVMTQWIRDVSP